MLTQSKAQMYLENQRGRTESEGLRSLHTFNDEGYIAEGRDAFGRLVVFNEETLAAGKSISLATTKSVEVILVPVVGGLELVDSYGESVFVSSGESFHFLAFPESGFKIFNPYPDQTINYLRIQIAPDLSPEVVDDHPNDEPTINFSLDVRNMLIPMFSGIGRKVCGFIGKYGGREEGVFECKRSDNGIFAFVIEGAFEVQNRLLEKGDALALLHAEILEFEALSNDAIILVLEVGM